jgi:hypothetical protein
MGIFNYFKHQEIAPPEEVPPEMSHYLYFPDRLNAEEAAALIRERHFEADLSLGADDLNWLVLVRHTLADWRGRDTTPSDYFEAIAKHFDGEYDGWEIGPLQEPISR